MRPLNRVDRYLLPPGSYKTYGLAQPRSHFRDVSCAQFECEAHQLGWQTTVDEATELGQRQAHYLRRLSGRRFTGRRFTEHRDEAGLTVFAFEAGQQCFRAPHRMAVKEPLYLVGTGDHRTFQPQAATRLRTARDWVDDFGENQDRLSDRRNQG